MQVVKEEDNSRFISHSLFLMLIIKNGKHTHSLFTNIIRKIILFLYIFFLRIFSCPCMDLFQRHMQLLLEEIAIE